LFMKKGCKLLNDIEKSWLKSFIGTLEIE
jgi:hypothetical protein